MLKLLYKILFTTILILFTVSQSIFPEKKLKEVVIFFAYNASLPAYQSILEGFRNSFYKDHPDVYNLSIEYLDIARISDEHYLNHIVDIYNDKFKETNIDLLITFGPGLYPLLEKHGFIALKKSSHIAVEFDKLSGESNEYLRSQNTLDIIIKLNFEKSLRIIFELFPKNENVFIVSGAAPIDNYYNQALKRDINKFEDTHNFNFISGFSLDSTLFQVDKIPSNSIVIITSFMSDKKNIQLTNPESMSLITARSKAPCFGVLNTSINKGAIGGYVFNFINLGNEVGLAANEILIGKPVNQVRINEEHFYEHIYDWQQLKKWNLTESAVIPANSTFYNKEFNFFSEYKWYFLTVFLFLVFESILIAYLIILNRRQKGVLIQKLEIENLYHQLTREDRLLRMVELTASLSHELNQPLTAILYNAQAGKRFLNSGNLDSVQAEEIFNNIIEDDKRAASLISNVKSLMKLEIREKERVNLNLLLQDTANIFTPEATEKNIQLRLNIKDGAAFVLADKIQLQQVILNFLSNAAIAMDDTELKNRTIEIHQSTNQDSVTVSVRDHGPGIDETIKEKIFKAFVTTREKGLGIGLAVSRTIIERHNGEIWAENSKDGGAEFFFKLKTI
jgi:signal transduction histidine kinase